MVILPVVIGAIHKAPLLAESHGREL